MANTSLRREVSVTGNRKIFTISAWVKKTKLADNQNIFSQYVGSGSATIATHFRIRFGTTDNLQVAAGGTDLLITNRLFRDTNAWYHVVCAVDTTQSTADDRVKLYINGVQETSFATRNNPTQNVDTVVNLAGSSHYPRIGADDSDGAGPYGFFNGLMSHIHFVDGTAYPASTFGSTDSVTGEWKLNTAPSITMGTNGFTILKDGNTITDQSTNSNDFISLGTGVTNTEDCPSNVFCTLNAINPYSGTLSNGNLKISQSSYDYNTQGTLGMTSGKYYWEVKMGGLHAEIGICEQGKAGQTDPQSGAGFYFIYSNGSGGVVVYNNATGSSGTTNSGWTNFASGQIIGVAYDADNGKLYFHNNGTYYNSGNPASGTGALITGISPQYGGIMVPVLGSGTSSARTHEINFGNGFFGTTAITSEGTNASGIGKFEYDVPTGFTALSTKGLNE